MVGVDVLQLPTSFEGNQYAVVCMDYFTKWPEVFAVADQKAEPIAHLLVECVVPHHGVSEKLLSDRGPNFLLALVQEVCKLLGVTKVNTSGYHPQCVKFPRLPRFQRPRTAYQVDFPDYCTELVAHLSDAWALAHKNIERAQRKKRPSAIKRVRSLRCK